MIANCGIVKDQILLNNSSGIDKMARPFLQNKGKMSFETFEGSSRHVQIAKAVISLIWACV